MDIVDGKATQEEKRVTEKLNENIETIKVNYHFDLDNNYIYI